MKRRKSVIRVGTDKTHKSLRAILKPSTDWKVPTSRKFRRLYIASNLAPITSGKKFTMIGQLAEVQLVPAV